jgi:hypothetical protein
MPGMLMSEKDQDQRCPRRVADQFKRAVSGLRKWHTPAANRGGGHYFRSGELRSVRRKAGGRYAADLALQLPVRGAGSVAFRFQLDRYHLLPAQAIARGYGKSVPR